MTGYVLDHLALIMGLGGTGTEHERREVSRLVHDAAAGGPTLDLPALCVTAAAVARPEVAEHVADLVATTQNGAIVVSGFVRNQQLDAAVALMPTLGWPATHAALRALATGNPILTVDPGRYTPTGLEVVAL